MFWNWNPWLDLRTKRTARVTGELRDIVNNGAKLFDFDYPIWNEDHKEELEKKIINHYACRQIGFETFGRFKHELMTRMQEIMPYYVELYKTTQFKYDPIENYNMVEEGTDSGTIKNNGKNINRYSNTPMGKIENLDTHLTEATIDDTTSNGTSESKHNFTRHGNIGVTSTQQLIQQERDLIINIDKMIIDYLKDLFLQVY